MTAIADVDANTAQIWQSGFQTKVTSRPEVALREQTLARMRTVLETALLEELGAELGFASYAGGMLSRSLLSNSGRAACGMM